MDQCFIKDFISGFHIIPESVPSLPHSLPVSFPSLPPFPHYDLFHTHPISIPFPSSSLPLPLLSLRSNPLKSRYEVWGAEIEIGAFYLKI